MVEKAKGATEEEKRKKRGRIPLFSAYISCSLIFGGNAVRNSRETENGVETSFSNSTSLSALALEVTV